jgi:broad specificity phosphatase PhoE
MTNLIVIRHGERLDEANTTQFKDYINENETRDKRDRYSRYSDAPLTGRGSLQAQEMVSGK